MKKEIERVGEDKFNPLVSLSKHIQEDYKKNHADLGNALMSAA